MTVTPNHTSEVVRQGFGWELLVRFSSGFRELLVEFAGVYSPRTPLTTISATPARHKTAIRMSWLRLAVRSFFFEPGAILLNGFHGNLQLRRDFRGRFAITK
jgi:hypothetical protein